MSDWNTETAEWYADNYGEYATNQLGIEALNLAKDITLVDVGCGTGSALRHASKRVTNGKLIGIDPVPRMIEIAIETTKRTNADQPITFHLGVAECLPLEDELADYVLAFDSFDHWENQSLGLQEISRVLKNNGRFVVVKDGGLPEGLKARKSFVDLLTQSGFEILAEESIDQRQVSFTLWVCKKTYAS